VALAAHRKQLLFQHPRFHGLWEAHSECGGLVQTRGVVFSPRWLSLLVRQFHCRHQG
jgi:hypothetical protein